MNFDEKELTKSLKIDAKGVGIPIGAAEVFIKNAIKDAKKSFKSKKLITNKDLERALSSELKKYNADLAYVYKNRSKII